VVLHFTRQQKPVRAASAGQGVRSAGREVLAHLPALPARLALALGDEVAQPLPLAAAANELYKRVGCAAVFAFSGSPPPAGSITM
jgi:hypothetical protein